MVRSVFISRPLGYYLPNLDLCNQERIKWLPKDRGARNCRVRRGNSLLRKAPRGIERFLFLFEVKAWSMFVWTSIPIYLHVCLKSVEDLNWKVSLQFVWLYSWTWVSAQSILSTFINRALVFRQASWFWIWLVRAAPENMIRMLPETGRRTKLINLVGCLQSR